MSGFIRNLRDDQVTCVKKSPLFREKLLPDIKNGSIFPAIRKDELHFYYRGNQLFVFSGKSFKYEQKYLEIDGGSQKITEKTIAATLARASFSFAENYEELKNDCNNYNDRVKKNAEERKLLSKLNPYTFSEGPPSSVVVLDVEVFCGGKKCDMMLFDTKTGKLRLVEGKLFEDSRMYKQIAPEEGKVKTIEILTQLAAYDSVLKDESSRRAIVKEYRKIIGKLNGLFDTTYPLPDDLLDKTKLLIYRCKPLCEYAKSVNRQHIQTRREACKEINKRGTALWCYGDDEPTLEQIWNNSNEYDCK